MFPMIRNIDNRKAKGPTLTIWRLTATLVVVPHR
jgi:hypothetical protein